MSDVLIVEYMFWWMVWNNIFRLQIKKSAIFDRFKLLSITNEIVKFDIMN